MRRRRFLKDATGLSLGVAGSLFGKDTGPSLGQPPSEHRRGSTGNPGTGDEAGAVSAVAASVESLNGQWLIATDPKNIGRQEGWYVRPVPHAREAAVPSIIQEVFPHYHGVAWFWREFVASPHPYPAGRYLLRFESVDYLAEVWLNGTRVGGHEGANAPFTLDGTGVVKTNATNLLAVRVLNPTNEPIDGIVLAETPHGNKRVPFLNGSTYDAGGITASVDLQMTAAVLVENLHVQPDWRTGKIRIQAVVNNTFPETRPAHLWFSVGPATCGETIFASHLSRDLAPGKTIIESQLQVANHRIWDLKDPYLYRVTVRVSVAEREGYHELLTRCGFRDFRVVDGYFRLNDSRLFLRSTHTGNHCPIGQILPPGQAPDLLRLDMLYAKSCGFNMVRFIAGLGPVPYQLDLCDEIGLMVYEEHYAAWLLQDSPKMKERFDFSVRNMVLRDRNHPSVAVWGLLNETEDGPVFRHAAESLRLVRSLDDTRLALLSSGRFDGHLSIGSLSNPGSSQWEYEWGKEAPGAPSVAMAYPSALGVGDFHFYPGVPPSPESDRLLRTLGEDSKSVFLSEYGIGSLMDVIHEARMYDQSGTDRDLEDYALMRSMAEKLVNDWNRFGLDGVYPFPEDMLADSQRLMARHRLHGFNLIRSNPKICGFNLTGMLDHAMTGEGIWRFWRDWKPGVMDAMRDGWAPLRWCLFVEPIHTYVGRPIKLEAVLANEDVLRPGKYPVRFRISGSNGVVWERGTTAHVPQSPAGEYGPFAVPALNEEITLNVPSGVYALEARMERGGAPAGAALEFYLSGEAPQSSQVVTLWGIESKVENWLKGRGITCELVGRSVPIRREIILVGDVSKISSQAAEWKDLAMRMARGGVIVFLSPFAFHNGSDPVKWLPLVKKGRCYKFNDGLYHKECVVKAHPIFEGLQGKGVLNWYYYGPVTPHYLFDGQETPDEVVAAAFAVGYPTPGGYASGVLLGSYRFGEGRFILNTFPLLDNLGSHPVADRLLSNLINYAGRFVTKSPAQLPADFEPRLKAIGYLQ